MMTSGLVSLSIPALTPLINEPQLEKKSNPLPSLDERPHYRDYRIPQHTLHVVN